MATWGLQRAPLQTLWLPHTLTTPSPAPPGWSPPSTCSKEGRGAVSCSGQASQTVGPDQAARGAGVSDRPWSPWTPAPCGCSGVRGSWRSRPCGGPSRISVKPDTAVSYRRWLGFQSRGQWCALVPHPLSPWPVPNLGFMSDSNVNRQA